MTHRQSTIAVADPTCAEAVMLFTTELCKAGFAQVLKVEQPASGKPRAPRGGVVHIRWGGAGQAGGEEAPAEAAEEQRPADAPEDEDDSEFDDVGSSHLSERVAQHYERTLLFLGQDHATAAALLKRVRRG